jgi:hypothetical protein
VFRTCEDRLHRSGVTTGSPRRASHDSLGRESECGSKRGGRSIRRGLTCFSKGIGEIRAEGILQRIVLRVEPSPGAPKHLADSIVPVSRTFQTIGDFRREWTRANSDDIIESKVSFSVKIDAIDAG